jgi:hypothetical protein
MALGIPAGVDPAGIRDVIGNQINPATEETLQSIITSNSGTAGFSIPKSDAVYVAYPNSSTEIYTFKLLGVTVAIVTVLYSDSTKMVLTSAVIT